MGSILSDLSCYIYLMDWIVIFPLHFPAADCTKYSWEMFKIWLKNILFHACRLKLVDTWHILPCKSNPACRLQDMQSDLWYFRKSSHILHNPNILHSPPRIWRRFDILESSPHRIRSRPLTLDTHILPGAFAAKDAEGNGNYSIRCPKNDIRRLWCTCGCVKCSRVRNSKAYPHCWERGRKFLGTRLSAGIHGSCNLVRSRCRVWCSDRCSRQCVGLNHLSFRWQNAMKLF
jgi:hypothetical protein